MTVANYANLPLNCPRCGGRIRYLYARSPKGVIVGDSAAADDTTVYVYACPSHGTFDFNRDVPVRPGSRGRTPEQ